MRRTLAFTALIAALLCAQNVWAAAHCTLDQTLKTPLSRVGLSNTQDYEACLSLLSGPNDPCPGSRETLYPLYAEPSEEANTLGYLRSIIVPRHGVLNFFVDKKNGETTAVQTHDETSDWGYRYVDTYPYFDRQGNWFQIPVSWPIRSRFGWVKLSDPHIQSYSLEDIVLIQDKSYVILEIQENGILVRPEQTDHDMPCDKLNVDLLPYKTTFFSWCDLYNSDDLLTVTTAYPRGC